MLRKFLQSMLDEAVQNVGVAVRRKHTQGLHIAIAVTKKDVQVAISRDKAYPSEKEWRTLLQQFPYFVPPKTGFVKFVDGQKRFALRGKLPRREQVVQQLPFGEGNP